MCSRKKGPKNETCSYPRYPETSSKAAGADDIRSDVCTLAATQVARKFSHATGNKNLVSQSQSAGKTQVAGLLCTYLLLEKGSWHFPDMFSVERLLAVKMNMSPRHHKCCDGRWKATFNPSGPDQVLRCHFK